MGGKPSKSACKIRGIRIIGVENPSHSVQIIMKFTIVFVCFLSESGFGDPSYRRIKCLYVILKKHLTKTLVIYKISAAYHGEQAWENMFADFSQIRNITILGVGLIGGSLGLALKAKGFRGGVGLNLSAWR